MARPFSCQHEGKLSVTKATTAKNILRSRRRWSLIKHFAKIIRTRLLILQRFAQTVMASTLRFRPWFDFNLMNESPWHLFTTSRLYRRQHWMRIFYVRSSFEVVNFQESQRTCRSNHDFPCYLIKQSIMIEVVIWLMCRLTLSLMKLMLES